MTDPTEHCEYLVHREVDAEVHVINDCLKELDYRKQHMSHFVSGLEVVVKSLLSALHTVKRRHSLDSKNIVHEEETTTQPSPKEEEEVSKVEEEQKEDPLTEDEDSQDSNPSSELMKSLNSTLEGLEQAEEKLTEMDIRDNTAIIDQRSGNFSFYLEFMHEFLADFRQKLQESCEAFMSMESQTLALLEERKTLQDFCFQLTNRSRKTVKPEDGSLIPDSSDVESIFQKAESEDSAPSEMESTLPKDICQNNILPDTEAAQKDVDSNDSAPSETKPVLPQKDEDKDTAPTDTSVTSEKDNIKHNTFPSMKITIKQTDDKDTSSNITPPPKDSSATPTTEENPDDKKQTPEQIVDEEYDYVSPIGMKRMFGSFSQEPKIFLPPSSPVIRENSPAMPRLNLEVSPVNAGNEP